MKIERFLLHSFEEKEVQDVYKVTVPQGSNFLAAKIMADGIYVWYTVSELEVPKDQVESFSIIRPTMSVPDGGVFIEILDTIIETKEGQGIIIFPLYKLK